jgi:hypothetical protein
MVFHAMDFRFIPPSTPNAHPILPEVGEFCVRAEPIQR